MNRRQVMGSLSALGSLVLAERPAFALGKAPAAPNASHFDPREFGATGDGRTLDTQAINRAIDACSAAGGGTVAIGPGRYLCGTVVLKSNVAVCLAAGAVILGSTRVEDYTPQPGPVAGSDAGQRHLIFAKDVENVSLLGPGLIDGQGESFWTHIAKKPVPESERWGDAVHAPWGHGDRVSPMMELVNCTNLRIEDLRIEGASGWTLRPINCTRVFIRGVAIRNKVYGPNTDGIDLTGCQDVMISDCLIDTGDDAICLKSENPYGAEPRLAKNIVITNCIITGCCNGFKIGTATQGGFENITFSNSVIYNDDVDLASRVIAGIAIEMVDGGWIDGLVITGIQMSRVRAPIFIRLAARSNPHPATRRGLRGVMIDGVHATEAIVTSSITGLPDMPIEDIRLSNIHIDTVMAGKKSWVASPVLERPTAYPQSRMFGWLPASGLYCRHVKNLSLHNITFTARAEEWRPTLLCDDVQQLRLNEFSTTPVVDGTPAIALNDTSSAWVSFATAPKGAKALVSISGSRSSDLLFTNSDTRLAAKVVEVAAEVPANACRMEFNIEARA